MSTASIWRCHVCGRACARLTALGINVGDRKSTDAIEIPAVSAAETTHTLCTNCWSAALCTAGANDTSPFFTEKLGCESPPFKMALQVVETARAVAATMVRLAKGK